MDTNEAKFLLQSFRPDGADAKLEDFQEALDLSVEDRELGEWFAEERAFDASISAALNSVPAPRGLREQIINTVGQRVVETDALDRQFIASLKEIQPPQKLREQILAAGKVEFKKQRQGSSLRLVRWVTPIAAAAAIIISVLFAMQPKKFTQAAPLAATQVQDGFLDIFKDPLFRLDEKSKVAQDLFQWVESKKLPLGTTIPASLSSLNGVGCRELEIGGKKGTLVCLRTEEGIVHLVVFNKEDVADSLPNLEHALIAASGKWSIARWADDENANFLLGKISTKQLAALL